MKQITKDPSDQNQIKHKPKKLPQIEFFEANKKIIDVKNPVLQKNTKNSNEFYEKILDSLMTNNEILRGDKSLLMKENNLEFNYLREAFGIGESMHNKIFDKIKSKLMDQKCNIIIESMDENLNDLKNSFKFESFEHFKLHILLLKTLLTYELGTSKTLPYSWTENFTSPASKILDHHENLHNFNEPYTSVAKWIAYTEVHQNHPLKLDIFIKLLDNIVEQSRDKIKTPTDESPKLSMKWIGKFFDNIKNGTSDVEIKISDESQLKVMDIEVLKMFVDSTVKLQDSFLNFIHDLHNKPKGDEEMVKSAILTNIFDIVKRVDKIHLTSGMKEDRFIDLMKQSLTDGTIDHLMKNINSNQNFLKHAKYNEQRLSQLIKMIKFTQKHFEEFVKEFGQIFTPYLSLSELLYKEYDTQLSKVIIPIVIEISNTSEGNIENFTQNNEAVSAKLFELYLELKKFSDHGIEIYGSFEFNTKEYFNWFSHVLVKKKHISIFNAMMKIVKSLNFDGLSPKAENEKHSSSAIETVEILNTVKDFWSNLDSRHIQNREEVVNLIGGDICRFSLIYFEKLILKYQNLNVVGNSQLLSIFPVIVANINYVTDHIQSVIKELTMDKNIDTCRIQKIVGNTLKLSKEMTFKLIDGTMKKFTTNIEKFIIESAQMSDDIDVNESNMIIPYIESILVALRDDLPNREFQIVKSILWNEILDILLPMGRTLTDKMPPKFFTDLSFIFNTLKFTFNYSTDDEMVKDKVQKIDFFLEYFGHNTSRLIHHYYTYRYIAQRKYDNYYSDAYGTITLNCHFSNNLLSLEILSTKDLIPNCPNKKYDLYAAISIVPEKYFPTCHNFRTRMQHNSHEKIEIKLSHEHQTLSDAIIYICIENKALIGSNECIAEAFLPFHDIPKSVDKNQIELPFSRLLCDEIEQLDEINLRSQNGDKEAKDFLTKLKPKTLTATQKSKNLVTEL